MSRALHKDAAQAAEKVTLPRRERRAERQRRFVVAREARLAALRDHRVSGGRDALRARDGDARLPGWLRPLDYRVSGETGAMRVPSKARTWHMGNRKNAHAPPPGQGWSRSGATYVTGYAGAQLPRPIIHHEWRRLTAEQMTHSTTE